MPGRRRSTGASKADVNRQAISAECGLQPGRITQLIDGDTNVPVALLGYCPGRQLSGGLAGRCQHGPGQDRPRRPRHDGGHARNPPPGAYSATAADDLVHRGGRMDAMARPRWAMTVPGAMPSTSAVRPVSRSRTSRSATTCRCRAGNRITAAMIRGSTKLSDVPPISDRSATAPGSGTDTSRRRRRHRETPEVQRGTHHPGLRRRMPADAAPGCPGPRKGLVHKFPCRVLVTNAEQDGAEALIGGAAVELREVQSPGSHA